MDGFLVANILKIIVTVFSSVIIYFVMSIYHYIEKDKNSKVIKSLALFISGMVMLLTILLQWYDFIYMKLFIFGFAVLYSLGNIIYAGYILKISKKSMSYYTFMSISVIFFSSLSFLTIVNEF